MAKPNGSISTEIGIAYLHGRLEVQIEVFADSIGISASELTYRMGELLSTKARGALLGSQHHVPNLRRAPAEPHSPPRTLALAGGAHGEAARSGEPAVNRAAGLNASGNLRGMKQVKKTHAGSGSAQSTYWAAMSAEEREAEMLLRMEKRTKLTPVEKRLLLTLRAKVSPKALASRRAARATNGKPKAKTSAKSASARKQQVYRERYAAKANGQPMPPLPA